MSMAMLPSFLATPIIRSDVNVSLVVPLRNEVVHLAELIDSIRGPTLPPDEILLVDGGSTDGTVALARRLTADG